MNTLCKSEIYTLFTHFDEAHDTALWEHLALAGWFSMLFHIYVKGEFGSNPGSFDTLGIRIFSEWK